jgi:hypothetical protein
MNSYFKARKVSNTKKNNKKCVIERMKFVICKKNQHLIKITKKTKSKSRQSQLRLFCITCCVQFVQFFLKKK